MRTNYRGPLGPYPVTVISNHGYADCEDGPLFEIMDENGVFDGAWRTDLDPMPPIDYQPDREAALAYFHRCEAIRGMVLVVAAIIIGVVVISVIAILIWRWLT